MMSEYNDFAGAETERMRAEIDPDRHEPPDECPACGPSDDPTCFVECVCACHD